MATVYLIFIWWHITSPAAFYLYLYLIASAGQGKCIPDSSFVPSSSNRRRPLLHSLSLHILENLENWENRDSREKDYNDSEEKMIVERKMKWWKRTPPLLSSPHTKNWINRDSATKLLVILGDFWAQEPRLHISSHISLPGSLKSLKYVTTDHVESHLMCLLSSKLMLLWWCFSCPSRFFPLDSYDDASKNHHVFF